MKIKYFILLTITIALLAGCSKKDNPSAPASVAAFKIDSIIFKSPLYVSTFSNASVNATSYKWNFGDDSTSVATNPVHNYAKAGVYIVSLTATGLGDSSKVSDSVTIPNASNFTIDLTLPQYQVLNTLGGSVNLNGVLVVRTSSGFVAVSAYCTYDNCDLQYNVSTNDFSCPCCQSRFYISGKVEFGPASILLALYHTRLNGNILDVYGP